MKHRFEHRVVGAALSTLLMRVQRLLLRVSAVLCLVGVACGGNGGSDEGTPVDSGGGVVSSPGNGASVSIPSGAISGASLAITVDDRGTAGFPEPDTRRSSVFEFGPASASFDFPVTISIALTDASTDEAGALHRLNTATNEWEEVPNSYESQGRVWGQTSGFSWYSAGRGAIKTECNFRDSIPLNTPGNVEVLIANQEAQFLIGAGTLFEQETGSRWITTTNTFRVQGIAGPPDGTGKWIDFASGPQFQTGEFTINADGTFSFDLDIPELGFRYLGITDTCLAPVATPENGWYYNAEVYCGADCPSSMGTVEGCSFPSTVRMQPSSVAGNEEAFFSYRENSTDPQNSLCELDPMADTAGRLLQFQDPASALLSRNIRAIQGASVNSWTIVSASVGTLQGGQVVNDLPDMTDITVELQDSDGMRYRLIFRFDGSDVTIKSFVKL